MKTKILLLALLLLPSIAMAQETRSQAAQSLTQLGMSPELSEKVAGLATGLGVISNATYLKWRNAAGSANIDVLNVGSGNQTSLNTSIEPISLRVGGTDEFYFGGDYIRYTGANTSFTANSADAADSQEICLAGGGACSVARGGYVAVYGNEDGGAGDALLTAGNAANSNVTIDAAAAAGTVILQTASTSRWVLEADGDLTSQATNGGDLNISSAGKTLSLQEGTAAAACMGTLTANGATPVVTSTTCAATGARIFLSRTSAETGTVNAWVSAISNGVSFSITSEAADTGTYNWIIFKEAP